MDDRAFDSLSRALGAASPRRAVLAALAAALGLAAPAAEARPGADGKGGGRPGGKAHGRNRGNGHGNGRNRKGKRCDPKPDSEVCAGKCGAQENNCGKRVRCLDCTCGTGCGACATCNPETDVCEPKPAGSCCDGGEGACDGAGGCDACPSFQACDGDGGCQDRACGAGGPCLVFVTSELYSGALNGLGGADGICNTRAGAANLPGSYMAWLSAGTESPSSRFHQSTGPYRLTTGQTVADDWDDLTDGSLDRAIDRTEFGTPGNELRPNPWTNTAPDGTSLAGPDCAGWSTGDNAVNGHTGVFVATDEAWTNHGISGCGGTGKPLYCFQQS